MTIFGTPATSTPLTGTTWKKRQFILEAYEELAMAGYEFDLTPEMMQAALRRLDSMMAQWESAYGIDIGYPLPIPADSDLDDDTDVEMENNDAIMLNLAARLAAKHGKQLSQTTKAFARSAFQILLRATPTEMQMPGTMPRGAGAKNWAFPFCDEPE